MEYIIKEKVQKYDEIFIESFLHYRSAMVDDGNSRYAGAVLPMVMDKFDDDIDESDNEKK